MECVYLIQADYIRDYEIALQFNTGERGNVDLRDIVFNNDAAKPLRSPNAFSQFYLDSWPTLAWKCGFDIAPETLYAKLQQAA